MISVTELRNGTKVEMDGGLWECLEYSHLKMGRGGAKVVTKFRNMETGAIVDRTFEELTGGCAIARAESRAPSRFASHSS